MSSERNTFNLTRRQFGKMAGAAGAALAMPGFVRSGLAQDAMNSAQIISGKKSGLIIHNEKLGVMETPLTLLRQYAHTPKDILFCRFHFPHEGEAAWYATTDAPSFPDWTITIDGLVNRPRQVKLADLQAMPMEKRVSVIQCAGNGRAFYAAKEKVGGGQWHNGGMGNVEWEGVPLRAFLDDQKLGVSGAAMWLTANGWDQPATPEGSDFAKSYRLGDKALDNAILALKMNGEPIPAAHGGPVRLIVPGYYGNMNVKQLTSLLFMADQSPSDFQSMAYRMPNFPVTPESFGANDYTLDNSEPTYAHKIKSVIFSPLQDDSPKAGPVEITGVAFNDGEGPIISVKVSSDGGNSWVEAEIEAAESPWAWYHWKAKGELKAGSNTLISLATDALGRSQPLDGLVWWNPRGYEWNGADHVDITV